MTEDFTLPEPEVPEEQLEGFRHILNEITSVEDREYIDNILDRFSTFERSELISKISMISRLISNKYSRETASSIIYVVSNEPEKIQPILDELDNEDLNDWLLYLNTKYICFYEGLGTPFPHDWYRIFWNTTINTSKGGVPLIELTIKKRNGESVYLNMPFNAAIRLIYFQLLQMRKLQNSTEPRQNISDPELLRTVRDLVNSLIVDETQ